MSILEKTPALATHYLHEAVKKEQHELIASLIRVAAGIDLNACDGYGMTALMWAAGRGYQETVRVLLQHGADVDVRNERLSVRSVEKLETGKGDYWELIDRMGMLEAKKHHGWTALAWAARNGHTGIVNLLLESGADIDVITKDGFTALVHAIDNEQSETAKFLLERGANPNLVEDNCSPALPIAAKYGFLDLMQMILDHGGDVKALDNFGHTATLNAVVNDEAEILKWLLKHHHDVNTINPGHAELPLLHIAACQDALECARVLLDYGAEIDAIDSLNGATALSFAVNEMVGPRVACLLIERGAKTMGVLETAQKYLDEEGASEVIHLLKQRS